MMVMMAASTHLLMVLILYVVTCTHMHVMTNVNGQLQQSPGPVLTPQQLLQLADEVDAYQYGATAGDYGATDAEGDTPSDYYGYNYDAPYYHDYAYGLPDDYGMYGYDGMSYQGAPFDYDPFVTATDDYCRLLNAEAGCPASRTLPKHDKCVRCATRGAVDVDGEGSVKLDTNMTRVSLGVEYQGGNMTSASDVQNEVSRRAAAVVGVLKNANVSELSTTAITLTREYQWINNQNTFVGYRGTNMVEFLLQGTNSGGIIDGVVNAGATRIDSIQFEATADAIIAARRTALTSAIKDAREKALSIAGTLGVNLMIPPRIDLYHVTAPPASKFSTVSFARNMMMDGGAPQMAPAPQSPLIPGKQVISATIRIAFEYTSMTNSDRLPLPNT